MYYDYLTINFATVVGIFFLLGFLSVNTFLDKRIKLTFYLLLLCELIEALFYSLELWTSTFEHLSTLRLLFSAIGYSVRPVIIYLLLCLTQRNTVQKTSLWLTALPLLFNFAASFSVFFTDIVYSYSADNQFHRGPLGFFTHTVIFFYLICLIITVFQNTKWRSLFETFIISALSCMIIGSIILESLYSVRTINRTATILSIIFYYMFFQSQIYRDSFLKEQQLRKMYEQTSRTDESTGLLTKKAFIQSAEQLIKDSPTSNIAFLFLDLDHLKVLNDTLGHAVGDTAILDTANTLRAVFRKTDLIGRFGGDEFCILLFDIPLTRFHECLEDALSKMQRTYSDGVSSVNVSASIGAIYSENIQNCSYSLLMQYADKAVYDAKKAGRNCYVLKEIE